YEFRDAPFFELYKEGPIRSEEYITEIWLPIV
ncbi:AraC family transcriptional regulator, partial [Rhodococcus hoagii]|nr:AraC family transcriptional regulator [Prescottella equi]